MNHQIRKILLPVDFSPRSEGAARFAEVLAEKHGAEVIMAHCVPPAHYEFAGMEAGAAAVGEIYRIRMETARERLKSFLDAELPGLRPRRILREGDPAGEIEALAAEEDVDIIVMPTHGYGPFRRFLVGSVTGKVLHDIDRPILTGAHLEEAPPLRAIRFDTIVAAVDRGQHSREVLDWASWLATSHDAKLVVSHAIPDLAGSTGELFDPDWKLKFREQAESDLAQMLTDAGIRAEIRVEAGDPAHVLAGVSNTVQADLLVIGRVHRGGIFDRLREHSIAIIRQSPCPVLSV